MSDLPLLRLEDSEAAKGWETRKNGRVLTVEEQHLNAARVPEELWPMFSLIGIRMAYKPRREYSDGLLMLVSEFECAVPTKNPNQWVYMAVPKGVHTEEQWRELLTQMYEYGHIAAGQQTS